ncbi:MAG: type IV pilus secretin PilQ [Desulfonatronovibrionaceae bacterium]
MIGDKPRLSPLFYCLLLLAPVLVLSGCAKDTPTLEKDPFFERWKELAEKSKGHSPQRSKEQVDIDTRILGDFEKKKVPGRKKRPELPREKVTLHINGADVQVILRALARAAGQNILVNSSVKGITSVHLDEVPWDEAFKGILATNGLDYTWEGGVLRVVSVDDLESESRIQAAKSKRRSQEEEEKQVAALQTKVLSIHYADADAVRDALESFLTKTTEGEHRGNIVVDKHNNALIVQAIKEDMDSIMEMVDTIDRPTRQIHLKAHIVEATKNTARDLGIQWGGKWSKRSWGGDGNDLIGLGGPVGKDGQASFGSIDQGGDTSNRVGLNFPTSPITGEGMGTMGAGLNLFVGNPDESVLEVQLSALQSDGKANVLSSPSLTTMDNKVAFTESGAKVPYVTTDDEGDREVEFEDAVLRLEMTPHVINDRYLRLGVKVQKDEVDFSEDRRVEGNPTIRKKETQTSLVVENGETIVISGLSKQTMDDSESGVPWLKDIPGLGYLFKGDSSASKMEELLIFITPTVLPKREDMDVAGGRPSADDLDDKLKSTHDRRADTWIEKSKQALDREKWQEVVRTASVALSLDPGRVEGYVLRGCAYANLEEARASLSDCRRALFLDPEEPQALNVKGRALEQLGRMEEALENFAKSCGMGNSRACSNHERLFYKDRNKKD